MRVIARLFLPVFTVWLIMFPALSYAATIQTYKAGGVFQPVTGLGAVALDIAALAGRASPWVGVAITGYQVARFVIDALESDGSTTSVNVFPNQVQQAPLSGQTWPGWTQDANGVWQPPATTTAAPGWIASSGSTGVFSNPSSACSAFDASIGVTFDHVVQIDASNYECWATQPPNYPTPWHNANSSVYGLTCPSGYSLSGSACNLSAPSSVMFPSDGKPSVIVKADGTGFQLDPRDPDNAPLSSLPSTIVSTGVQNGSPFRTTVTPVSGGGLTISSELQIQNSDGSTSTYKQTATLSPQGKVTDSSAANYPGSLGQQTTSSVPSVPSTVTLNLPTDYNREATQLQIKTDLDSVKTNTDPSLVPADVDSTSVANLDSAKAQRDAFKADIDALPGSVSPVPVASLFQPFTPAPCQPLSWTFNSVTGGGAHTVTYDICPWVPAIQRVGSWAMYLLTAAMLFQMFTRRPDGGN